MGLITGQLRTFARKSSGQLQPVALCHALDNALALLEPRLRQADAEIIRHCPLPEPLRPVRRQPAGAGAGQPDRQRARCHGRPADTAHRTRLRRHRRLRPG
jgi:hypothetical protein